MNRWRIYEQMAAMPGSGVVATAQTSAEPKPAEGEK